MDKIDIKALARQLKKDGQKNYAQEVVLNQDTPQQKPSFTKVKKTSVENLILEVNDRKDFNCIGGVYIDEDLYELLRQLKLKKKLKIGCFVSWLIEQYVTEHQGEIIDTLSQKQNKYLPRQKLV